MVWLELERVDERLKRLLLLTASSQRHPTRSLSVCSRSSLQPRRRPSEGRRRFLRLSLAQERQPFVVRQGGVCTTRLSCLESLERLVGFALFEQGQPAPSVWVFMAHPRHPGKQRQHQPKRCLSRHTPRQRAQQPGSSQ